MHGPERHMGNYLGSLLSELVQPQQIAERFTHCVMINSLRPYYGNQPAILAIGKGSSCV